MLVHRFVFMSVLVLLGIGLCSCADDEDDIVYTPKPKAYLRINFPEKKYTSYNSLCPYTFEIPVYAVVERDANSSAEPCWINIKYPQFRAQLHVSYKQVNNNLSKFLEDSRELAVRHQIKASGLEQQVILRDTARVFGMMYDISGNTASSVQFYVTDSTKHFLRGSLYFNSAPNIDSMKIVIDFLKKDLFYMIQTFSWKDQLNKPN